MVKLSVSELEAAIKLIRKTSHDMHISIHEDPTTLRLTYANADSEVCTITLYAEETKVQAKFTSSTSLAAESTRRKL